MTKLESRELFQPWTLTPEEKAQLAAEKLEYEARVKQTIAQEWRTKATAWVKTQGCTITRENGVPVVTGKTGKAVLLPTRTHVYRMLEAAGWPGCSQISEEDFIL